MPIVLQETMPNTHKGKSIDTKGKETTPISVVRRSARLSGAGVDTKFSIPHVDLEALVHMPTQSPRHAVQTPKHENVPEKASLKPNSPNISFVNIDSDTDSLSSFD